MSLLGFPSASELSSMMGYVTDEDRQKWAQMKEASDKQIEGSGLTAKGLASKGVGPTIGIAEKAINNQMQAEQFVEREAKRRGRKERVERTETETRTRFFENDVPPISDESEMGF